MIARDTVGNMTSTMTYTFLGDGTKAGARVRTIVHDNGLNIIPTGREGKIYRGSFVYNVSASGAQSLQSIAVSTGRLIAVDTGLLIEGNNGMLIEDVSFKSDAFFTDHLGNVAAVVNISSGNYIVLPTPGGHHMNRPVLTGSLILEQNDYLPFGTRMPLKTRATNRYRYSGKEEQNIAGVDLSLLD
ncbi:MAG: hypothetical protein KBS80_05715, partial [Bacteroidales bacterium]|nr:hypothetical protein [Candidatus Cryptobacteroides choladohippi]